ncbi:sensor histidine kinase [Aquisalimonas asiatica]|uniref:histidine kinase n=1 Tax=Aquisalimonas asiatica TaxID=406100 RepID=A0A1H8VBN5_9GAMM|nr:ATP-binding protein [Aquisalimonas asiatica]SEP12684.1 signal transduction histidine kinase [Aquisalimonas asiatica]
MQHSHERPRPFRTRQEACDPVSILGESIPAIPANGRDRYTWRPLRLFAYYRLVVALMLAIVFLTGQDTLLVRSEQPVLFLQFAFVYLVLALMLLAVAYQWQRALTLQVCVQALVDIFMLSALIYTAGAQDPGLGVLMLVAVAGCGIFVERRLAALFAAVATLTLLFLEFLAQLDTEAGTVGYAEVGAFGIALFLVTLAGNRLAQRAREEHALAEQRGEDLADQEVLNGHIVQRLQDGVLVLDRAGRVRLINATAWKLLGQPPHMDAPRLEDLCLPLAHALTQWQANPREEPPPVQPDALSPVLQPRFRVLSGASGSGVLIFLEDLAEMHAQVQQVKLASLGRLTASIAHEIRNPLSAMTHAGQLLGEAELAEADQRLVSIIQRHGQRLNDIVENVLRLSRRQQPDQDTIHLRALADELDEDVRAQPDLHPLRLRTDTLPGDATVEFDPGHLHQVLMNLVRNAAKHARHPERELTVTLMAGRDPRDQPYLDIIDNGPGIATPSRDQLFDPFFTTAGDGTGLGLYLCRELCEANHARLSLLDTGDSGTRFRITFTATGHEQT